MRWVESQRKWFLPEESLASAFASMKEKDPIPLLQQIICKSLTKSQYDMLHLLIDHLSRLALFENEHMMSVKKLSECWYSHLFGDVSNLGLTELDVDGSSTYSGKSGISSSHKLGSETCMSLLDTLISQRKSIFTGLESQDGPARMMGRVRKTTSNSDLLLSSNTNNNANLSSSGDEPTFPFLKNRHSFDTFRKQHRSSSSLTSLFQQKSGQEVNCLGTSLTSLEEVPESSSDLSAAKLARSSSLSSPSLVGTTNSLSSGTMKPGLQSGRKRPMIPPSLVTSPNSNNQLVSSLQQGSSPPSQRIARVPVKYEPGPTPTLNRYTSSSNSVSDDELSSAAGGNDYSSPLPGVAGDLATSAKRVPSKRIPQQQGKQGEIQPRRTMSLPVSPKTIEDSLNKILETSKIELDIEHKKFSIEIENLKNQVASLKKSLAAEIRLKSDIRRQSTGSVQVVSVGVGTHDSSDNQAHSSTSMEAKSSSLDTDDHNSHASGSNGGGSEKHLERLEELLSKVQALYNCQVHQTSEGQKIIANEIESVLNLCKETESENTKLRAELAQLHKEKEEWQGKANLTQLGAR